jgi:hypothetical protein
MKVIKLWLIENLKWGWKSAVFIKQLIKRSPYWLDTFIYILPIKLTRKSTKGYENSIILVSIKVIMSIKELI